MRTIIRIRCYLLLVCVCLSAQLSHAQCSITDGTEDIIRFGHRHSVTIDPDGSGRTLTEMQASFRSHFFSGSLGVPLTGDETITVDDVLQLRSLLSVVQKSDYINALEIHFGLDKGRVVFIYEPGYLIYIDPSGLFSKTYKFISSGQRRVKGTAGMVSYDESVSQYIKAYADLICIAHNDEGGACSPLRKGNADDNANDVQSVLIPIQEILKEYCQNNGDGPMTGTDDINLLNIALDDPYQDGIETDYKHSIAIRVGTSTAHDLHAFTGYAADFNEMCPPRCVTHTYKIKHAFWDLLFGN